MNEADLQIDQATRRILIGLGLDWKDPALRRDIWDNLALIWQHAQSSVDKARNFDDFRNGY